MKKTIFIIFCCYAFVACSQHPAIPKSNASTAKMVKQNKPDKPYTQYTEADWKKVLTEDQYDVLREKGTERPFTGDLLKNKKKGTYVCAACGTPLYESKTKFDSGTGWPSFYQSIGNNVQEVPDNSYGMTRTEIVCATCKGHLGHVFDDGPEPTGLRHCVNSLSLGFEPSK